MNCRVRRPETRQPHPGWFNNPICLARGAQPKEGAAFTLSGIWQSLHRRQAFARGQIVYDAWDQTGKGAG
jgi:hypothetical protein